MFTRVNISSTCTFGEEELSKLLMRAPTVEKSPHKNGPVKGEQFVPGNKDFQGDTDMCHQRLESCHLSLCVKSPPDATHAD